MRELLLLRHAEAAKAGTGDSDCGRPLTARGAAQARAVGAWLAAQGATPDVLLCSPARRALMTATEVGKALPLPQPEIFASIYQGAPGQLLTLVADRARDARRVLLVGHNPVITQLLVLLAATGARDMSPASLAWIEFADATLAPGHGHLRQFRTP